MPYDYADLARRLDQARLQIDYDREWDEDELEALERAQEAAQEFSYAVDDVLELVEDEDDDDTGVEQ